MLSKRIFALRQALPAQQLRCFAGKGPLSEKERGDEKQFFNKEDEKVLKNLLKKMQAQQQQAEDPAASKKAEDSLRKVFKEHKYNEKEHDAFFQALLEWKKSL